jgi:hypothetical protein
VDSQPTPVNAAPQRRSSRLEWTAAIVLAACALVVGFWEVMSNRARKPFQPFELTSADFAGFAPRSPAWTARPVPIAASKTEPNVVAFLLQPARSAGPAGAGSSVAVLVRLVHGYNMVDCMRIKGYTVELIGDTRAGERPQTAEERPQTTDYRPQTAEERPQTTDHRLQTTVDASLTTSHLAPATSPDPGRRLQFWRVTSSSGDAAVWVTSMLRAGDFGETDADVRSMAFPRIGTPDDPNWVPRGLTRESLRHPVRNFKLFMQHRWSGARSDWLTFLGLRQPAWASAELFTLVGEYRGKPLAAGDEAAAAEAVAAAHGFVHRALAEWRASRAPSASR